MYNCTEEDNESLLCEAGILIAKKCLRWRIGVHWKTKYGTLRISTTCAFFNSYCPLHSLINPGYAFLRWGKFMMWLDLTVVSFMFAPYYLRVRHPNSSYPIKKQYIKRYFKDMGVWIRTYQERKYFKIMREVADMPKFSHVRDLILQDSDGCEIIDPAVYHKYWK